MTPAAKSVLISSTREMYIDHNILLGRFFPFSEHIVEQQTQGNPNTIEPF